MRLAAFSLALMCLASAADQGAAPVSLAELADMADMVALVRVQDTDYQYRRDFPTRGSAFLEVLIPYKGDEHAETIVAYEEGLRPGECYFPAPPLLGEGRRYLVFLRRDPDNEGRFRGMDQGCALDVLVTDANRYAVRVPADGIAYSNDLSSRADDLQFADRYALEDEESISPARRDALLLAGQLETVGERYRYTRGIRLETFRPLLEIEPN